MTLVVSTRPRLQHSCDEVIVLFGNLQEFGRALARSLQLVHEGQFRKLDNSMHVPCTEESERKQDFNMLTSWPMRLILFAAAR